MSRVDYPDLIPEVALDTKDISTGARARRERDLGAPEAIERARAVLRAHRLVPDLRVVAHSGAREGEGYQVTRCELTLDGRLVASGSGKGHGDQAVASCLFESVENHIMLRRNRPWDADSVELVPIEEVAANPLLRNDSLFERMRSWNPAAAVGCTEYTGSDGSTLLLPVALADVSYHADPHSGDDFDYTPFLKYFSTNGIASGVAQSDATTHALLEVLERDAISRMMLGIAGLATPSARPIADDDIPGDLRELLGQVSRKTGGAAEVYSMATFGGVAARYAICRREGGSYAYVGSGCSPWQDYATERAVSELFQDVVMMEHLNLDAMKKRMLGRLAGYPALQSAMNPTREQMCGPAADPVRARGASTGVGSTEEILRRLYDRMHADGLVVYRRLLLDDEVSVVSIYVPGLERFGFVTHGSLMMPTGLADNENVSRHHDEEFSFARA